MSASIHNVVFQHAENVCALWHQRDTAVEEPHYSFSDLENLDKRVEHNLQGLRIAGQDGLEAVTELHGGGDPGAIFARAVLLLEQDKFELFLELVNSVAAEPNGLHEMCVALAWIDSRHLSNVAKRLLESEQAEHKILGLYACDAHARTPGSHLKQALLHDDEKVREMACHVCANRCVVELIPVLLSLKESNPSNRFANARALAFLGEHDNALQILKPQLLAESNVSWKSLELAMCISGSEEGRRLLKQLNGLPDRSRDVIRGFGALGDPRALAWIADKLNQPDSARIAGFAISFITGVDLAEAELENLHEPEGYVDSLNDDPASNEVAMDEDENLPWPNPENLTFWCQHQTHLQSGKLYLSGMEKNATSLNSILQTGLQRHRNAASLSLAVTAAAEPYRNTRLPSMRQREWMI